MSSQTDDPLIEVKDVGMRFGSVEALSNVDLALRENEVLGLVGDNGAGKSTLIKILVGIHEPTAGRIKYRGEPVTIDSPKDARDLGIATVYQDLALVDELSVAKNVFLGRNPTRYVGGMVPVIDEVEMREETNRILEERLDIHIDPDTPVEFLSGGERQAIAIARALVTDPEIILMDEPTSALSQAAVEKVERLVRTLQEQGHSIIIIDHNLDEIFSWTDRIAVLHNGRIVDMVRTADVTRDDVISMMISGQPIQPESDSTTTA